MLQVKALVDDNSAECGSLVLDLLAKIRVHTIDTKNNHRMCLGVQLTLFSVSAMSI